MEGHRDRSGLAEEEAIITAIPKDKAEELVEYPLVFLKISTRAEKTPGFEGTSLGFFPDLQYPLH